MALQTRRLARTFGAEIMGVDLSQPIGKALRAELQQAFLDYGVVLYRDQNLTPEQQITLTSVFGEPDPNASVPDYRHPDYPEILLLTNERRNGKVSVSARVGQQWHSDQSMIVRPTLGSILHAQSIPDVGGDTMFADMYAAYDALSSGMKAMLEPMRAVHDVLKAGHLAGRDPEFLAAKKMAVPPVVHSVVRVHPETGRKALYVNEMMTSHFADMTEDESAPLLNYLFQHSTQPRFTYRHQWRRHDLLMWDNRCTMHLALGDFDPSQLRKMHRTALVGAINGELLNVSEARAAE